MPTKLGGGGWALRAKILVSKSISALIKIYGILRSVRNHRSTIIWIWRVCVKIAAYGSALLPVGRGLPVTVYSNHLNLPTGDLILKWNVFGLVRIIKKPYKNHIKIIYGTILP